MQISESARLSWVRSAWKHDGEIRCDNCDTIIDLSEADTLDEARASWNAHVDEAGGQLYV